jgi:hypothetical protein
MKMTQIQMLETVLAMLNRMNLSLTKAEIKVREDYLLLKELKDTHDDLSSTNELEVFSSLNKVMCDIVSLTSVYSEAARQASSNSDLTDEVDSNVENTTKMKAAAAAINNGKDAILSSIGNAITTMGKIIESDSEQPHHVQQPGDRITSVQETIYKGQLSELIGENGLLFQNLSPEMNPLGKGTVKPSDRFPAFLEDVTEVPVNDLTDYPEGFYDVRQDGKPNQLFLRFGNLSYLWLFNSEHRELLILNNGQWISLLSVPSGSVKIFTQMLSVYFQTLHLR